MAVTAAICVGALAIAVVLFVKVWWWGLIALGVSLASGAATVLMFMGYQAERRRRTRLTEQEEEDKRIMELISKTPAEETLQAGKEGENASEAQKESALDVAEQKPSTLEMRPPLRLLSVEEALEKTKTRESDVEREDKTEKQV